MITDMDDAYDQCEDLFLGEERLQIVKHKYHWWQRAVYLIGWHSFGPLYYENTFEEALGFVALLLNWRLSLVEPQKCQFVVEGRILRLIAKP